MQKKSNAAYDFSLFEPTEKECEVRRAKNSSNRKKEKILRLTEEQLYKSQRRKYKPLTVMSAILSSFVILAIISTVITSQIELTELTAKNNQAQKDLAEKQSVYTQLEMKVESKLSLNQVEAYAKNVLGMQPIQPYQIEYISITNGDKSEVKNDNPDNWIQAVNKAISGMLS